MPTFPKLVAAILFAALAAGLSWRLLAVADLQMRTGWLLPVNTVVGALAGWRVAGARAGGGIVTGAGNGVTTGIAMGLAAILVWALHQTAVQALRRRMDDPSEAIAALGENAIEVATYLARLDLLGAAALGAIGAGVLVELVAGRRP